MSIPFRILFITIVAASLLSAQPQFLQYHEETSLFLTSPGAMGPSTYAFGNPALLTYLRQPDILFAWSDVGGKWNDFNQWGLFCGTSHIGFGVQRRHISSGSVSYGVTDYRLAASLGDLSQSVGIGFGWSGGDADRVNRKSLVSLSGLLRPLPHISVGAVGKAAVGGSTKEIALDVGVRPMGSEFATVFADFALLNNRRLRHGTWSVGTAVEPLPGIRITGRYFDTRVLSVGINVSFGGVGVQGQRYVARQGGTHQNTFGLRVGAYDRNIFRSLLTKPSRYLEINLNGPMKYRRFVLFDQANTLLRLLDDIEAARVDPSIAGIAINMSGMVINTAMLWEIRSKLEEFKASGRRVIIFVDRAGIEGYYFASVADEIVMDPTGIVTLEGFLAGRMFMKGTLEKLGVGFEELRYFKYKSAVETFSRDSMSAADREQRQKLLSTTYELVREGVVTARGLTPESFDRLMNHEVLFLPADALRERLVDTIGRWEKVTDVVKRLEGKEMGFVGSDELVERQLPKDNRWGESPRIAVIYALGVCAMDEGITARKLVKDVEVVTEDERVKAVVLRVDSPGGDALASDVIAEALRKCREKKPVIVSQGQVAASGGYWLSMYADTIVAAPTTVTGSIGVIGFWFYNEEFKDKVGASTDHVKIGEHADIGFGIRLPLFDVTIPDRNLTEEERRKLEQAIRVYYREFVEKVASGRKKSYDEIESVAQGRVWSGSDGRELGLVDVLGGLDDAIRIAREKARIPKEERITIVELPEPGLLDFSKFTPKLITTMDDPVLNHIRFRLKHNGQIMPILPLEEGIIFTE